MALISRIGFTLFDRWGANLGRLPYTAATHTEALDGTDELKITCDRELSKGQRIVWIDRQGIAHEHIVDEVSQAHDDNGTHCEATCINSIAELLDDYIEDKRPSGGVAVALASVLSDTRWEVGSCDLAGSASHTFYHVNVREALSDLVSAWGGELETTIEVDGAGVARRAIGVRFVRGNQESPKRFTWTKDIVDIKRVTGTANPKTRVYGYGKGVETDGGGYGRRLTFGDINDGKDYVEDEAATAVWGHPDGNGGVLPAVDTYINEQCEDAEQLLAETLAYLETAKEPTVSYEANVLDLYAYGRSWEGVALGDCVAIIDKQFVDDGIRLKGRVSQIERDLITADATVTFGNLVDAFTDLWQTVATALKSGSASRASYDAVANPSVGWLTLLQSALNKQFNAVGTYKVESFELGQIFSNVALNPETGLPIKTTSGMWAVNINGMGIRLASSLNAQGEWDWTTFITGTGVNADCINVGTLRADLMRVGLLTDAKNKNYWDLDSGEFSLSADSSTVDGKAIATTDEAIADVDIEYAQNSSATVAPTDGWQTSAPAWAAGKYIWQRTKTTAQDGTITYSVAAMISGRDGEDGKSPTATVVKSGSVSTITITNPDGTVTKATVNDGTDGTQGVNGYVHVKYSDDGGKTFTGNTGEDPGKYIGVYTDNTKADSTSVSSYTWSLIKGADGEDGTGISAIAEQYYLSTSNTTQAGGSWLDTCPAYVSGRYYWTRSQITWDDGTASHTTPVLANGTNSANSTAQAAKDAVAALSTQEAIFNLLTNNGAIDGLYMKDGKLYVNASYIGSGVYQIQDSSGNVIVKLGSDVENGLQIYDPYTKTLSALSWTALRPVKNWVFTADNNVTIDTTIYLGTSTKYQREYLDLLGGIESNNRTLYAGENGAIRFSLNGSCASALYCYLWKNNEEQPSCPSVRSNTQMSIHIEIMRCDTREFIKKSVTSDICYKYTSVPITGYAQVVDRDSASPSGCLLECVFTGLSAGVECKLEYLSVELFGQAIFQEIAEEYFGSTTRLSFSASLNAETVTAEPL